MSLHFTPTTWGVHKRCAILGVGLNAGSLIYVVQYFYSLIFLHHLKGLYMLFLVFLEVLQSPTKIHYLIFQTWLAFLTVSKKRRTEKWENCAPFGLCLHKNMTMFSRFSKLRREVGELLSVGKKNIRMERKQNRIREWDWKKKNKGKVESTSIPSLQGTRNES